MVPDAEKLEATHAEWLTLAEKALRDLRAAGFEPHGVPVKVAALKAWCDMHGWQPDARARAEYASAELQRLHEARLLDHEPNDRGI
jgi:hypothetical protein